MTNTLIFVGEVLCVGVSMTNSFTLDSHALDFRTRFRGLSDLGICGSGLRLRVRFSLLCIPSRSLFSPGVTPLDVAPQKPRENNAAHQKQERCHLCNRVGQEGGESTLDEPSRIS